MRELKFRAWDAKTFEHGGIMHYGGFSIHATGKIEYTCFVKDGSPIMQYTGLKDCEGKEIYEGDIIMFFDMYYVVTWPFADLYSSEYAIGEIKGNIYENPELIK